MSTLRLIDYLRTPHQPMWTIHYPVVLLRVWCPMCHGAGIDTRQGIMTSPPPCPGCEGKGWQEVPQIPAMPPPRPVDEAQP
jgi:hypothetical protein